MRGSTINKLKKNASAYELSVSKLAKEILQGRVLAVDPSSGSKGSMPGYAIYFDGKIESYGTLEIDHRKPIQQRLFQLYHKLEDLKGFDVLVVERIRGSSAHEYLHWAVGVTVAAVRAQHVLEIPTTSWKKLARQLTDYAKGDDTDALMMLAATLKIAGGE